MIHPNSTNVFIRLAKPADRTEGGVWLPERCQENRIEGTVLAAGPGFVIPGTTLRSFLWVEEGDRVLFEPHTVQPLGAEDVVVREEALLAVVDEDRVRPLNEWVLCALADRVESNGGIAIPEEYQRRERQGRILDIGPGKLRLKGPLAGIRQSVSAIMAIRDEVLRREPLVYWTEEVEVIDVQHERNGLVLIRAGDIAAIEADDTPDAR